MQENNLETSVLKVVGDDPNGCSTNKICRLLRNTPQELGSVFERLRNEDRLLGFAGQWFTPEAYEVGKVRFLEALNHLHAANPTQQSFALDVVVKNANLNWSEKPLDRLITKFSAERLIEITPTGIRSLDVPLQLTPRQLALLTRVIEVLEGEVINTPSPQGIAQQLGIPRQAVEEILKLGVHSGVVLRLDEGVFYTPGQIESLKNVIKDASQGEPFAMTDLRDKLESTRKYISPLLDYMDRIGFTSGHASERIVIG